MSDNRKTMPPSEYLWECFDYDFQSGLLTWQRRPFCHFEGVVNAKQQFGQSLKRVGLPALNAIKGAGYRMGSLDGTDRYAHRIIWKMVTGVDPDVVDHINRVKTDNSWGNLRDVSQAENNRNKPVGVLNTSGQIGVFYHSQSGGWLAQINNSEGRTISFYSKKRDAVSAWRSRMEAELGYLTRSAA